MMMADTYLKILQINLTSVWNLGFEEKNFGSAELNFCDVEEIMETVRFVVLVISYFLSELDKRNILFYLFNYMSI